MMTMIKWLSGGEEQYHRLTMCLNHDPIMTFLVVFLCMSVGISYLVIVWKWMRLIRGSNRSKLEGKARRPLGDLCFIFILCSFCSYFFLPLKLFWPAWKLWVIFMLILNYFSWKYALFSNLNSVYFDVHSAELVRESLNRMSELTASETRSEIQRLKELIDND